MFAQESQIRVFGQPLEITIAQREGFLQGGSGEVKLGVERMAAGQIIKHERVPRLEPGKLLVDFQAMLVSTALSVMVAQDLERLDEIAVAFDDPFQETDFGVEVPDLLT